jgi:GNAT superfamily N-acetyltransferase
MVQICSWYSINERQRKTGRINLYPKPWKYWVNVTDNLNRMPLWFIHINKLYILKRSANTVKRLRSYKSAVERVAGLVDSKAIAQCSGKSERKIRNRLENGDICFISEVDGAIAGYLWMSSATSYYEDTEGIIYITDEETSWLYDGFVTPEYRVKGIWVNLQYALIAYLQKEKKQCVVCSIEYDNVNSINTHLRFGYEPTHIVISICVLGLTVRCVNTLNPKRSRLQISSWNKCFDVHV